MSTPRISPYRPSTWRLFEVRDVHAAARLLHVLLYGSSLVMFAFAVLAEFVTVSSTPRWWYLAAAVTFGAAVLAQHRPPKQDSLAWLALPLLGAAFVAFLNIAANDGSAAAQIVMCIPVLFAATHLHPPAVGLVSLVTVVLNGVVAFTVLPSSNAVNDTVYVGATLLAMAAILVRAGRRQDVLVARLHDLATVDPLTGMVTRRVFDEQSRAALAAPQLGGGTALIVMDVDHFKEINDEHGHLVGDDVLVHIAHVLRANIRTDALLCRLGGDEIAVLMPRCTYETACVRAEDLVSAIHDSPMSLGSGQVQATVSVGVAHAPQDGITLRDVYGAADAALYRAKRAGRGRVGMSSPLG